jgi:hypothetical protein
MLVLTEAVRGNLHGFVAFSSPMFPRHCGMRQKSVEN